jgi:hypothetical protein
MLLQNFAHGNERFGFQLIPSQLRRRSGRKMPFTVEIAVTPDQLASRMAQMRFWLDDARAQPSSFRSRGADTIQVTFEQEQQAIRFAREFRGDLRAGGGQLTFLTGDPAGGR